MNSLEQLNAFSTESIPYTDDRPFGVNAVTNGLPTTNTEVRATVAVDFSNFGVIIKSIYGADDATSDHLTLTFDFSAAIAPTVTWPTAPNAVQFSEPTPGVFVATKIQTQPDYEFILNSVEILATQQNIDFSYTVSVSWPGTTYTQQFDATAIIAEGFNLTVARSFTENTTQTDLFDIGGDAEFVPSVAEYLGFNIKLVITTTNVTIAPYVVMQPSRLIAPGASYPYATSIEKTGTPAEINSWLSDGIGFIPESGTSDNHTVNWEIQNTSGIVVYDSGEFTVAGTARIAPMASEGTYTYNWNGVDPYFELDITEEMRLYCNADILLAGGGGAGGNARFTEGSGGSGGAGGVAYVKSAYVFSVTDAQVPSGYGTENSPQFRFYLGEGGSTTLTTGQNGVNTGLQYYANGTWNNIIMNATGGGGGGGGFASSSTVSILDGGNGTWGGGGGGCVNGANIYTGQGGDHTLLSSFSNYLGNYFGDHLIKSRHTDNIDIDTESYNSPTTPTPVEGSYGFSDQGWAGTGPAYLYKAPNASIVTYGTTDYTEPGIYDATWQGHTPGYDSDITGTTVTYGDNGGNYSQGDADGNRSAVSPTNGGNGTVVVKVKAAIAYTPV